MPHSDIYSRKYNLSLLESGAAKISFQFFSKWSSYGDSSVLHSVDPALGMIFASLTRANERMHVHDEKNLP